MKIDDASGKAMKARWLVHRDGLVHLCNLAEQAPDGTGVEVGIYVGSSLIAWALVREGRGECIGIDNWAYSSQGTPQQKEKCLHNIETSGAVATVLEMTSIQAAVVVPGPLAFVFIDGDHAYTSVMQDIELWTTKIVPGGVVAFHDYGARRLPGVTQAIDEWHRRAQWVKLDVVSTVIGFKRP
jgi:predicted O-methyltransferase YrrM